jgi:PTH1 family peptidyl-tRNA hydrolase
MGKKEKMNIFDLFKKIEKKEENVPVTHIIVGLGNPGKEYELTRHNAGFIAIDHLCINHGGECQRAKFKALVGEMKIGGKRVLLMKPQTYMNSSGEAIIEAVNFYKIPPENVIVISDDITLDVGRMRIRKNGSAGGHNGLKSIISHLGTDKFPRLRIGVGQKPTPEYPLVEWVLAKFPKADEAPLKKLLENVLGALEKMVNGDIDGAMCDYNGIDTKQ